MTKSMEQYDKMPGINASAIKAFDESPLAYYQRFILGQKQKKKVFDIGSLIDGILTTPEKIAEDFIIMDNMPENKVKGLVDALLEESASLTLLPDELYGIAQANGMFANLKKETLIKKVFETGGMHYYERVLANPDKIIISKDDQANCEAMVAFAQDSEVFEILKDMGTSEYQKAFFWSIAANSGTDIPVTINMKGLADRVIFNHPRKEIVCADYKSTSDILNFDKAIRTYKYYYQGSIYMQALKTLYPEYYIKFMWVPIDKFSRIKPCLYELTPGTAHYAEHGGTIGQPVRGWRDIAWDITKANATGNYTYTAPAQEYPTLILV